MSKLHGDATLFIDGNPIATLGAIDFGHRAPDPSREHSPPVDSNPGKYDCSFTCIAPIAAFLPRSLTGKPVPVIATYRVTTSHPTREPYRVTSEKSRSGVWHYGCPKLGQSYWKPCPTALERRKMRSRIEAFNRIHPPGMSKRPHVESIVGDIRDMEVTYEANGTARATLTIVARTAPAKNQPFFAAVEGVSSR